MTYDIRADRPAKRRTFKNLYSIASAALGAAKFKQGPFLLLAGAGLEIEELASRGVPKEAIFAVDIDRAHWADCHVRLGDYANVYHGDVMDLASIGRNRKPYGRPYPSLRYKVISLDWCETWETRLDDSLARTGPLSWLDFHDGPCIVMFTFAKRGVGPMSMRAASVRDRVLAEYEGLMIGKDEYKDTHPMYSMVFRLDRARVSVRTTPHKTHEGQNPVPAPRAKLPPVQLSLPDIAAPADTREHDAIIRIYSGEPYELVAKETGISLTSALAYRSNYTRKKRLGDTRGIERLKIPALKALREEVEAIRQRADAIKKLLEA